MIPDPPDDKTSRRISWIAGAQYGIVSLHATNPFIVFGEAVTAWSIELLLQGKATSYGGPGSETGEARFQRDPSFDPQAISALDLHRLVRQSVLNLAADRSRHINASQGSASSIGWSRTASGTGVIL